MRWKPVAWVGILGVLTVSAVEGASWQQEAQLLPQVDSDTQLSSTGRAACADLAGNVCVLLRSRREDGTHRLSLTREGPLGVWSPPEFVTDEGNALNQSLSVDSQGGLHAVWMDTEPFPSQIKYRYRAPGGVWAPIALLSPPEEPSQEPVLCVDSLDRVHAVWVEEDPLASKIMHAWTSPGGAWSELSSLDLGRTETHEPTLAPGPAGTVDLIFVGEPSNEIGLHLFHTVIDVDAGGFGAATQLTKTESKPQLENPFLESDEGGILYLVWMDNRFRTASTSYDIYLRRYLPGVGWGHEKRVTYEGTTHVNPAIYSGPGHTWNITIEALFSGNPQVAYRQITREFGWDPQITHLTGSVATAEDPHVVPRPDGSLLLLWSEVNENGVKQVLALEGAEHP